MARLKLFFVTLSVLAFLMSLWAIPAFLVFAAFMIKAVWLKVIAGTAAAIWMIMVRPWNIFKTKSWSKFLDLLAYAIHFIIWGRI